MIRIVTDSTCDLPIEVIKDLDIAVIPLYINIGEEGYLDGVDITRKDFYSNLPDYPVHPTTGTPGTSAFLSVFEELRSGGADQILSIHISENLSATVNVARTAAGEYQKAQVTVVDSGQLSLGTGFQVELAARMAKEGRTLEEILTALQDLRSRTFVTAGLNTLEYLRRSGRMNRFMTGIGSLLKIRPILTMKNGLPGSERVRTLIRAEKRLLEMFKDNHPFEKVAILHTNAQEKAQDFLKKVSDLMPEGDIYSVDITPVIGSHIGPGAVGYAIISENPL